MVGSQVEENRGSFLCARSVWVGIFVCLAWSFTSTEISAQDVSPREVDDHFVNERSKGAGVFRTLPGTHISPKNNRLVFGTIFEHQYTRVKGQDIITEQGERKPNPERLKLNSYSVAPYVGISGKSLGAALLTEYGAARTRYDDPQENNIERSRLNYHGLGAQLFFSPGSSARSPLTFVLGSRYLSASHKATSTLGSVYTDPYAWETIDYHVVKSHVGANLNVSFLESFSVIPWMNTTHTTLDGFDTTLDNATENEIGYVKRFVGDRELYWDPGWSLQYGLDFAVRVYQLEVHFGNLMGAALQKAESNARIQNQTVSVSVIYYTPTN